MYYTAFGLKTISYHCTNSFRRDIIVSSAYSLKLPCSLEARFWLALKVIYTYEASSTALSLLQYLQKLLTLRLITVLGYSIT